MSGGQANFQLHQLVELLTVVSSFTDEASATRGAVECAAATLEAEVAAVVLDGVVVAAVGFPSRSIPHGDLVRAARGELASLDVPGAGLCWTAAAALGRSEGEGFLVLARSGESGFSVTEGNLIRGMARVLMLTLKMLQTLAAEREMHHRSQHQAEENARLLRNLRLRNRLIEKLQGIRRAITRRGPLLNTFELIVDGAHDLLAGDPAGVSLWLLEPDRPGTLALAQAAGPLTAQGRNRSPVRRPIGQAGAAGQAVLVDGPVVEPGHPWSLATSVHQKGMLVGSLMLSADRDGDTPTDMDHQILSAFAEHVSLAMSDAKSAHEMYEAFHDSLTGLPSRRLFLERLRHALAIAESEPPQIALFFIDLDHFKAINDTLGHAAGDSVLIAAADRIQDCLGDEDVAARLGGDEFAVMLQGITPEAAVLIAGKMISALREPVEVPGGRPTVTASIGISFSGQGSQDLSELLSQADAAMYQAKRNGRGRFEIFDRRVDAF
jgi:diguanylate cyclase (GGDEF)-like protein